MKPVLFVGNQNYSSWSLRPWLVLTWAGIEFETRVIPLGGPGYTQRQMPSVLAVSPGGTVPVPRLWPEDPTARFLEPTESPPLGRKECRNCRAVSFDAVPRCPSCDEPGWRNE